MPKCHWFLWILVIVRINLETSCVVWGFKYMIFPTCFQESPTKIFIPTLESQNLIKVYTNIRFNFLSQSYIFWRQLISLCYSKFDSWPIFIFHSSNVVHISMLNYKLHVRSKWFLANLFKQFHKFFFPNIIVPALVILKQNNCKLYQTEYNLKYMFKLDINAGVWCELSSNDFKLVLYVFSGILGLGYHYFQRM